jgi:uncharacterized membrane protein YphA (DoxX/SURF4 family)
VDYAAKLNWFLPAAMIPALALISTAAETILGLLLVLGWKTRITALLSGVLLTAFAVTMTMALGVKAPLKTRAHQARRWSAPHAEVRNAARLRRA